MKHVFSRMVVAGLCLVAGVANADQFKSLTMEFGADRMGGDYRSFTLNTNDPLACQVECAQDNVCQAYAFIPAGLLTFESRGPVGRCYLKNTQPAPSQRPGVISGIKLP